MGSEGEVGPDLWAGREGSEAVVRLEGGEGGGGQPGGGVGQGGGRPGERQGLLGEHRVHQGRPRLQGRPVAATVRSGRGQSRGYRGGRGEVAGGEGRGLSYGVSGLRGQWGRFTRGE